MKIKIKGSGIIEEIELIGIHLDTNRDTISLKIPQNMIVPTRLEFYDPFLLECDTATVDFINFDPLKRILRIEGIETLKIEENRIKIKRGSLFLWKDILPSLEAVLKIVSEKICLITPEILPDVELGKSTISYIERNKQIFFSFKKRASCGACMVNLATKEERFTSFALELGKILIQYLVKNPLIEKFYLMPYTVLIKVKENVSLPEIEMLQTQIEKIIKEHTYRNELVPAI